MVSSNGTSIAELNIHCMLASVRREEDIVRVLEAGISESCFVGAEHYWLAFDYIRGRIRKGKTASKTYIKRKFGIDRRGCPGHGDSSGRRLPSRHEGRASDG